MFKAKCSTKTVKFSVESPTIQEGLWCCFLSIVDQKDHEDLINRLQETHKEMCASENAA